MNIWCLKRRVNTGNSHQNVNLTGHSTLEVSLQTIFFFAVIAIEHPSTQYIKREKGLVQVHRICLPSSRYPQ